MWKNQKGLDMRATLVELLTVMSTALLLVNCQSTSQQAAKCSSVNPTSLADEQTTSTLINEIRQLRQQLDDTQQQLKTAQNSTNCNCNNGYPTGWTYLPSVSNYYRVIFELVDWDTAASRCRELGSKSHLVVVNDATENGAIRNFLASLDPRLSRICDAPRVLYAPGYGGYWTSGQRANRTACGSTPWVWRPNPGVTSPVTFTDWCGGGPSCGWGTEQCFHYGTDWFCNFQWNDLNCAWPACPFCELHI